MRILLWHVHGSWTTGFVQGSHDYVVPVLPDRSADGVGRARSWQWPPSVRELTPTELGHEPFDLVILQRPHERELLWQWTGRRAGHDVAAVYLEHNVPGRQVPFDRHPMADQSRIPVIHVTSFNALMWDCGSAPTHVIEHGVIDPGDMYTGELGRAAVVVNEPVRRGRAVGTDLVQRLAAVAPVDVFGMDAHALRLAPGSPRGLRTIEGLDQARLHTQIARRRLYLHPNRWTSLGLSLVEAMLLGMPVVALASTEVPGAVPPEAGVVSTRPDELADGIRMFCADAAAARAAGTFARAHALRRFGLHRFLDEWDAVMEEAVAQQADGDGPGGPFVTVGDPPRARVTVVIMTRDRWLDLERSLPHHPLPVVLVDNASRDGTPGRVSTAFPDIVVVKLPRNAGAPARNEGVRRATTPYVAFADDDSWWEPGALDVAADLLDAHPGLGLLVGRVLVGDEGVLDGVCEQMARSPLGTRPGEPGPRVLGFIACGAVVRKAAFLDAGGFDDVVFFPGEEERLSLDLAARGWGLCYVSQMVARHMPSTRRDDNPARQEIIARNALLTSVMRRPASSVLTTVCRRASNRCGRRGLVACVPRLRAALRERRVVPATVEAERRTLDRA